MKIDIETLKTPANYGKLIGKGRQWVYKLIASGKLKKVEIDGVIFVQTKPSENDK